MINPPQLEEAVIERGGCLLHYWLTGPENAPLVVLTHGAMLDHHMFAAQVAVLAKEYRVLTWDMRGHGLSQPMGGAYSVPGAVDDLQAILSKVSDAPAAFVGQSTGGYVGQEMVYRTPKQVAALVMIDCTCITLPISALEKLALRSTPWILRLYPTSLLNKQTADTSSLRADVQAYILEAASHIPKRDVITIWTGIVDCLHDEPGYHIDQPLLLVHGDHDKLGNIAKVAPLWASREPNCRYEVIPDAGHCSNQDNPDFFNRVLLDFLHKFCPGRT